MIQNNHYRSNGVKARYNSTGNHLFSILIRRPFSLSFIPLVPLSPSPKQVVTKEKQ
jgi:hypothetical protein